MIGDAVARGGHALVAAVLDAGNLALAGIEGRDNALAHQGLAVRAVEEDGVGDVVFPEQRRPEEEGAAPALLRRAAGLRLADAAHAPGAVLGAEADRLVDPDLAVGVTH